MVVKRKHRSIINSLDNFAKLLFQICSHHIILVNRKHIGEKFGGFLAVRIKVVKILQMIVDVHKMLPDFVGRLVLGDNVDKVLLHRLVVVVHHCNVGLERTECNIARILLLNNRSKPLYLNLYIIVVSCNWKQLIENLHFEFVGKALVITGERLFQHRKIVVVLRINSPMVFCKRQIHKTFVNVHLFKFGEFRFSQVKFLVLEIRLSKHSLVAKVCRIGIAQFLHLLERLVHVAHLLVHHFLLDRDNIGNTKLLFCFIENFYGILGLVQFLVNLRQFVVVFDVVRIRCYEFAVKRNGLFGLIAVLVGVNQHVDVGNVIGLVVLHGFLGVGLRCLIVAGSEKDCCNLVVSRRLCVVDCQCTSVIFDGIVVVAKVLVLVAFEEIEAEIEVETLFRGRLLVRFLCFFLRIASRKRQYQRH